MWAALFMGMAFLGQGLGHPPDHPLRGAAEKPPSYSPAAKEKGSETKLTAPPAVLKPAPADPVTSSVEKTPAASALPKAQAATTRTTSTVKPSPTANQAAKRLVSYIVCLDPGHQAKSDPRTEPIGPGSNVRKPRAVIGAVGTATRLPEHRLTLTLAQKLEAKLKASGATVVMTRATESANISNVERALICARAGADLFVRIHADGNADRTKKGFSVLYPALNRWTAPIAEESKRAAGLFRLQLRSTGASDLGLKPRGDLTGFNWSKTPVVLTELGFLSNPAEDRLLATPAYQEKLVSALARAVEAYLVR